MNVCTQLHPKQPPSLYTTIYPSHIYRSTAATAITTATPLPTFFAAPPVNNGSVPVVPLGETGTPDALPVGLAYKVDEAWTDPAPVGTRREVPAEPWGWLRLPDWLGRAPEGLGMDWLPVTVAVMVLPVSVPVTALPVLPGLPDPLSLTAPVDTAPVAVGGSVSITVVGVAAQ